ncbi:MAG: Zn-ribbon containing protein, partial [Candidatus Thermoplasmatota archaeon]|nr:Zn-ribbon containing protein [Candidatus Thermoplasmatota archaeon]
MPHQCLNCGHIIERGSREILKGCSNCGGKKFMFVDQPMPEEKRNELKMKADRVREEMLKKADAELFHELRDRGIGHIGGKKIEMDESLGEDWVRVREEGSEGKIEISEGEGRSGLEVVEHGEHRSARDMIRQFDMEQTGKEKVPDKKPSKKKKKASKKKGTRKKPARAAPSRKKDDKAVISIIEQGVYEIDVERL